MKFHHIAAVLALVAVAAAAGSKNEIEMKVRVFVAPEQIELLAGRVLEFYDVTADNFVGAITRSTYEDLVRQHYRIEVLVPDVRAAAMEVDAFFHTYQQIRDTWAIIAQNYPDICLLDTLGTSAGGNLLLAMKISDNPGVMEMEPRICFDFTIHGNENNCTEVAHWVLLKILEGYGTNPDITRWVDNREIWLLPMVNPDGLISRSRSNANGVDCNRNYGYSWNGGGSDVFSEPETRALYHLGVNNPMASWTQYHSGTERAMWAWGYTQLATMDSVIHRYEMVRYSQLSGYPYCQIARGLYPVNGGSTDWYYGATGAQGYGIEVCNGQPSQPSQIDEINAENWLAMKEMIERVMWGISGRVTDSVSGAPLEALVSVNPPDWFTHADSIGFFHKNLHAGTYSLTVSANGYEPKTIGGIAVPADTFVFLEVALAPDSTEPWCALRPITNKLGNSNPTDAWWALRKRDGRRFSLDRGAWASFDIGRRSPILNGPGNDFFVVEDDGDPEGYSVFAANDWNGPWTLLGTGTGTQGFDLQNGAMTSARFVRIMDDNSGTGGFEIDAIEAVVVNAPAVTYVEQTVIDSPPGGNGDGKLDPGENADLIVTLKNIGRLGVTAVSGKLRTLDNFVTVTDSTGAFGDLEPDSTRSNWADRFRLAAASGTPREHVAAMKLHLEGTDYTDSLEFQVTVGELRAVDPIPDGPRQPALYWAYDDTDSGYAHRPDFEWVEISGVGTRLTLSDDQTVVVPLPSGFVWRFYGQQYSQLSVCGNGFVCPGSQTYSGYSNQALPYSTAPGLVALNWDDLFPPTGGGVWHWHDAANHRFIVEWDSVHYYSSALADKFQLVLYDTTVATPSGDNEFKVQYLTANNYVGNTVGIQDQAASIAIEALFNGSYHRG
ncbi:carboxypeptidase regulatory-like domain-containing protein, partial [candidate division WOR-3 bacterium]|nr:carboxypeptidase regulatory-like domain-containing protein [candidate division WOR-3 bacterium]